MPIKVLVTRPAGQADRLCEALSRDGYQVSHQPLLELTPLEALPLGERQHIVDLDLYQHVVFISANAVRFGMERIDDFWPQLPAGLSWYAIGATTASLLRERGISPVTPAREMTSEGLLSSPELQSVTDQKVLIVKGVGGRETLRETLSGRGARVDELACYRRSAPNLEPGEVAAVLEECREGVVLISSGEGLANMLALLSDTETTKFRHTRLLVPSVRVEKIAREAGFSQVAVAANASDAAMEQALQKWTHGESE